MFLHLGENYMIAKKEIVLIGNLESTTLSEYTKEFINIAREEGFVIDYSMGNPKSFVLTDETIYLSLISSNTLSKRMKDIPGKDGGL